MTAPVSGDTPLVWSSRLTFLMASVGFAVGLGNIWRFPYVVGENGGSAFILIYLTFAILIGVPLVMAEWTIGRRGNDATSASGSFRGVATQSGASTKWGAVGGIAVLAVFMLMLIYTTIAGWTMDYFVRAASGAFEGITSETSAAAYEDLMASPWRLVFWHTVVVVLTVYINSRGLHGGIEKAVNILMPALFLSLVIMVGYAAVVGDMAAAANFLLTPDFSKVTGETVLMALGQAFFSIGIAMAVMITYGSYMDQSTSIAQNAVIVVGADTLVALLAGFAIFPLVFQHGMTPSAGEGLVFQTLPVAFGDLPAGSFFASVFFFLLIAAAVTSCIGNFAPVVAWTEEKFRLSHSRAAFTAGFAMWVLGIASALSFNVLSDFHPLDFISGFEEKTIFASIDYIMANALLPIGALLTAIFIGWIANRDSIREEIGLPDGLAFKTWLVLIRFVIPTALVVVFLSGILG
ncbi:sodium-dependent transporter [Congregibacter sp.]|jgi:NSS family neurotransmitter:Na+ symporter|uniref:sodium-dependent transporter n=1 Tax=Congregibacter sp. TaxID=2744308 RepID=UPI0039E7129C